MNTDGSDLNQLTHFAATTVGDAVWSPDGTELAVSAGGDDFLYVLAADGSVLRKIEPAPGYGVGDLAWRPVAATPTPSDTASVAALSPCTADQLHLTTGMQGENTTARIGVNVDNLGAPCVVPPSLGPITITIERGAGDASVKGNPLTLPLPRRIRHGTAALQLAGIWSNWCGSQPGLRIFVRFEGSVICSRTSFVPECLWPGSPSTLVSIR